MKYQKCPICNGTGLVSRPPGVPGDVDTWVSNNTTYPCPHCKGERVIMAPGFE